MNASLEDLQKIISQDNYDAQHQQSDSHLILSLSLPPLLLSLLSFSLPLSFSLSLPHSLPLSYSLPLSFSPSSHSLSLLSFSLSLSSHSLSLSHSLPPSSHSLPPSLCLPLSVSLSLSLFPSL